MGYGETQIAQIKSVTPLGGKFTAWASIASLLPMFAYLIYVKRLFAPEYTRFVESDR
jgi:hypothetical protein